MGKQQAAGTPTAKAEPALKPHTSKKKGHKASEITQTKAEAPVCATKDGGGKSKKGQKSEIDDIFSAGKTKAQESAEGKRAAEEAVVKDAPAAAAKRPRVEGSKDDIFGEAAGKGRKRTDEGFPIYTEDELGMGKKGGDTDLCPFDCDCCF